MADTKLFGKYNDVVMMLLGFVLTGVVGTYIAQVYTTKAAELAAATKLFGDVSKMIGDRYFAMSQVMLGLEENGRHPSTSGQAELDSRWIAYRKELQKWNSLRGYNRELIRLYFGDELWNAERDIHYFFRAWGQSLEREQDGTGSVELNVLTGRSTSFLSSHTTSASG